VFGTIVAKAIIVLVVFPVIGHAIYSAVMLVLARALPSVLALTESWSAILDKGVVGATILLAAAVSWNVCRRLWPTSLAR
jgi:hypothetical protein